MTSPADATAALLGQLSKLAKGMSDDTVKSIASGEAKATIVFPGERVIVITPAIEQALKLVAQLSPSEQQELERKAAKLVLIRTGDKLVTKFDAVEMAERISNMRTPDEIISYLDEDSRLTAADLKKVAKELSVSIPASAKGRPAIQVYLASEVVRNSGRWSWR